MISKIGPWDVKDSGLKMSTTPPQDVKERALALRRRAASLGGLARSLGAKPWVFARSCGALLETTAL